MSVPRMEWPIDCEVAPEVRREVEAEVYHADLKRQRRAAPALARRPSDVECRLQAVEQDAAALRRSLTSLVPGSISDGLARAIGTAVADLRKELSLSLRLDIASAEKRATSSETIREAVGDAISNLFQGTWSELKTYSKGQMVVSNGSLWICVKDIDCGTKPGNHEGHGVGWRLAARGAIRPRTRND
jgi:hypothetical protein